MKRYHSLRQGQQSGTQELSTRGGTTGVTSSADLLVERSAQAVLPNSGYTWSCRQRERTPTSRNTEPCNSRQGSYASFLNDFVAYTEVVCEFFCRMPHEEITYRAQAPC